MKITVIEKIVLRLSRVNRVIFSLKGDIIYKLWGGEPNDFTHALVRRDQNMLEAYDLKNINKKLLFRECMTLSLICETNMVLYFIFQ